MLVIYALFKYLTREDGVHGVSALLHAAPEAKPERELVLNIAKMSNRQNLLKQQAVTMANVLQVMFEPIQWGIVDDTVSTFYTIPVPKKNSGNYPS